MSVSASTVVYLSPTWLIATQTSTTVSTCVTDGISMCSFPFPLFLCELTSLIATQLVAVVLKLVCWNRVLIGGLAYIGTILACRLLAAGLELYVVSSAADVFSLFSRHLVGALSRLCA